MRIKQMKEEQPRTAIYVCQGFDCRENGSAKLEGKLEDRFGKTPDVEVIGAGCLKRCEWAPCIRVIFRDENGQLIRSQNFFKVDKRSLFWQTGDSTEDVINEVLGSIS